MKMVLSIIFLSLITSCSNKNNNFKDEKLPPILEVSVGYWDIEKFFSRNNDEYLKYIENKFRIRFIPRELSWEDYTQKIIYWASSDQLPDIFVGSFMLSEEYFKWIDQKKIRPLFTNLDRYPNLKSVINQAKIEKLKIDDHYYFIPRINAPDSSYNSAERGIISRKDWRKKLGFEIPQTFEEYLILAKAFKNLDPDNNGIDDTIGITFANRYYISTIFLSSVPEAGSKTWKYEDKRWIPGYVSKDMLIGINEINTLWKENVLDPNLLTLSGKQGEYNFCEGKTGMLFTQIKPRVVERLSDFWNEYNDSYLPDIIEFLPIWKNSDGERYSFHEGKNFWSSSYFSSRVSDEMLDRILQLYDFLLSEEGHLSLKLGVPGIDYEIINGEIVELNSQNAESSYPSISFFMDFASWSGDLSNWIDDEYSKSQYDKIIFDKSMDLYAENKKNLSPVNMDIQYLYTPLKSRFEKGDSIFDTILNIAIHEQPSIEWYNYINSLKDIGLEQLINEVNTLTLEESINTNSEF